MRLRHVAPFLALFAWQVTPAADSTGHRSRFRIWYGGGQESSDFSYWGTGGGECLDPGAGCDCYDYAPTYPVVRQERDRTDTRGLQADAWVSPALRASAMYGSTDRAANRSGGLGDKILGGLLAWEGRSLGAGGGYSTGLETVGYEGLSAYVRFGTLEGVHLRVDLRPPTATPGATGWAHAGLAVNQAAQDGPPPLFFGIAAVKSAVDSTYASYPAEGLPRLTRPAFFADIAVPVVGRLGIFGRGHLAKGARGAAFGLVLGL